jgi:histidinol-phosphate aminotransferase
MLREGIIVRPLASFGLPNGLRISVGTRADNERAIAALRKALAK